MLCSLSWCKYVFDMYWSLRLGLLRSLLRAICNDIDAISIVEAVQFGRLIQECEVSVGSYPRLTITEVVLGLC